MVSGAIFGALFGAFFTYLFAIRLENYKKYLIACSKLRAAFAPALAQIELGRQHNSTHEAPDVDGFLRNELLANASAVEEFRPFVNCKKNRKGYQKAWSEYCEVVKGGLFVAAYDGEEGSHAAIQKKIHAILAYAEDPSFSRRLSLRFSAKSRHVSD